MMRKSHFIVAKQGGWFLFLLIALLPLSVDAAAQSRQSVSSSEARAAKSEPPHSSLAGELAKETREAAGEGEDSAQFKHSGSVQFVARLTGLSLQQAYWLCVVLNFAVIAGVVFWVSRTRLPGVFRERTVSIQKAMRDAQLASEEAGRRLAGIEARLSKLDVEIAGMRAAAEKEAAAEEARIQAAALEEGRRIAQAAEEEIAAAGLAARRELTAHAANLAVTLAGKQIRLDAATDQALVQSFAQQFPAAQNGGSKGKSKDSR